jgi:Xaa-Pro aminopeptidase
MASETAVGNVYLPLLAAERPSETRYEAMTTNVEREIDPWDGGLPRETRMANLLRARFPTLTVQNLSPILNDLRARKSDAEIAKIRKATRVGIAALVESMRSTRAGLRETDLEAVASFVSLRSHARPFTPAVVASGSNTFDLHYNANDGALRAGDLVFMQSTASLDGYATDVARMWPVDGRFTPSQLEIYRFYLACYDAILKRIRPGPNPQEINKETGHDLEQILQATHFEHAGHAKAASEFVRIYRESVNTSRMTVGYGYDVGLSPRDVSTSPWRPLQTGAVLTVQPFFYVPDDHLMMRISDVVLVTADGAEVLSKELPRDPAELQRLVGTGGMLQASARAGSQ